MGHAQGRIQIDAEPSAVWRWVTDPSHFPDFVEGWVDGGVVTPNATGPGAAYDWTGAVGPLRLRVHERVVEWREGERVEYVGSLGRVPFRSSMEVEASPGSRSRLEAHIDWKVPLALGGAATDRLLRPIVQADVERSLERVAGAFATDHAESGILTRADVARLYRHRAARYDVATQLYRLVGFPLARARREAVDALGLRAGDTVVEIGCGTGANFPLLQERIGPTGRIIGVDLTDPMLEQARRRIRAHGWRNVDLVLSDAATYEFPERVNGILSTLALTLCREYDTVIARGARVLSPGGRWVIFDLRMPKNAPEWLIRAALPVVRPYGVSRELAARRPWESLRRHLPDTRTRDLYFGLAYLAVGEKAS
jgi:ubiquinone/menaquinone biosynthesis C-methylase UbiE